MFATNLPRFARAVLTANLLITGLAPSSGAQSLSIDKRESVAGAIRTLRLIPTPESLSSAGWEPTGGLATARLNHTATLLPSGKVFVVGGWLPWDQGNIFLSSAELYDPATGSWTATQPLQTSRYGHTATLLPSGKVLVVGGSGSANAELYDPAAGTWTYTTVPMQAVRSNHTATLLPSGKVLIAGGSGSANAELYDPIAGTWTSTAAPMQAVRSNHTATLLPSGKVLVTGGSGAANAELYDPAAGTWMATVSMQAVRSNHTATLLSSGKVLASGGSGSANSELYDPSAGTWTSTTGNMQAARTSHTATLLPSGRVLVAGGTYLSSAEIYDPATQVWSSTGQLASTRAYHTATLLSSGRVLVAAGSGGPGVGYLASAELFDPTGGSWTSTTGTMQATRTDHTATLLPSGKILVAGGWNGSTTLSGVELYDPATGLWTSTGSLVSPGGRAQHTATLLPSGKVLVAGGVMFTGALQPISSAELYDPAGNGGLGSWSSTGSLQIARAHHTATLLPSGKILAAGGSVTIGGCNGCSQTSSAELFDPSTGLWSPTGSLPEILTSHTATLLPSGKVLVAGGTSVLNVVSTTELYDPATETWSLTSQLAMARASHTATVLPSGRLLIAGGSGNGVFSSAELFDPETQTWSSTGSLSTARYGHTATLLASGKVLVVGGYDNSSPPFTNTSAELFDPATGTWITTGALVVSARTSHTATLLPSGTVLISGGFTGCRQGCAYLSSSELFSAGNYLPSRQPAITSFSPTISFGSPFSLTGTTFRGDSEGSGGTSSNSSVNYPLVSLLSIEGGQTTRLVPDSRCILPATCNFWDDPMTLTVSSLPTQLNPGWQLLTVTTDGVPSVSQFVDVTCSLSITPLPPTQIATIGGSLTLTVQTQGGRTFQWQKNGVDIPWATAASYTTPPVISADSGSSYRCVVGGACSSATSSSSILIISDSTPPVASLVSPTGGEYWLLSTVGNPPNTKVVTWSMSDNVRVCQVAASLLYSNDGGATYSAAPTGGGLPATFGTGGSCPFPGALTTSVPYTVPTSFPSGRSGSLYKIQVVVTDQAGNATTVTSPNPFYIVQSNPDSVRTLILWDSLRMVSRQGISNAQTATINGKLQELANHPRVQGVVIDLGSVTAIQSLDAVWDADPSNASKANAVLFGTNGIHDYVRTNLLAAYSGIKYLAIVGDDRIIPMARMQDHTVLLPESSYPAGGDLTPSGTTVGQALAAGKYLTDDPLAVLDPVTPTQLDGNLFLPDLAVGRLVETPQEIITAIATYIGQDGILDLSLLDPANGHKVLVTGYDFLSNASKQMRARWKSSLGITTADNSLAPVDGSLVGGSWSLGSVSTRSTALRTRISGNGGARYGVMAIAGHATHYEEGVPGTDPLDIQGLSTADIYGADSCTTPSLGALDLSGGIVYALGCHGGLSVPGSCRTDADHSLDLPETMLGRGVVAYIANSGYGWGLKFGIGYGARLTQIFTEQMTSGGTIAVGDAVKQSKQRYYLETPRYDPYDEKSVMQWTLYGLPMYALKTGIAAGASSQTPHGLTDQSVRTTPDATEEMLSAVRVRRQLERSGNSLTTSGTRSVNVTPLALPSSLTQLNLSFDFTASGVYTKHDSAGNVLSPGPGCADLNGCYYTLNGLVDRGTGSADLPIQPYLIYDSRLSGTSQHGVLWKGGTYDEESGWTPVIAQLVSNGGDGSNHGSSPRVESIRPTAPRVVPGIDSPTCRPSDLEVNSLTVAAGEAVKNQTADPVYSIARRYRTIDLEVYYFNNQSTPSDNCDRSGPALGTGPYSGEYHQKSGSTLNWAVPASDPSGVWRVVIVYNTNAVDGLGRGTWTPLDLINDGTGTFRGNISVNGVSRLTYMIQAVDNRGNITWLDYVSAQLPASAVALGLPKPVDVTTDAPTGVVATATTTTSVAVSWSSSNGAASYDVYRSASVTNYSKIGSSGTTNYTDNTAAANTAYLYAVKAIDAGSNASALSNPDLATAVIFTDPTLTVGSTLIKAAHIIELRTAVNAVRTLAGLGAYSFTDPTITAGLTTANAVHITDLRTALNAARAALSLTALVYTDAPLTPNSTVIKAAHINDLRNGVQ